MCKGSRKERRNQSATKRSVLCWTRDIVPVLVLYYTHDTFVVITTPLR